MANSNSVFVHPAQNYYFAEDKSLKETAINVDTSNNVNSSDFLQCFVCDSLVQGKHYTLASCKTQSTRTRVIEKLGELVGERYMVVISENDIICRSCANLINTLDRLEMEMKTVKGTVLRYLERKYYLENGELETNDTSMKSSQLLNVTATNEENEKKKKKSSINITNDLVMTNKKLISCDKCRYSTNYQTFMIHHLRQHINQKINCDKCGIQFIGNNQHNNSHSCKIKTKTLIDNVEENLENNMVDINNVSGENNSLPLLIPEDQNIEMKNDENIGENLSDFTNVHMDMHEINERELNKEEQSTIDNTKIVTMTEQEDGEQIENNITSVKQILKLRDDGSLEMIQMNS